MKIRFAIGCVFGLFFAFMAQAQQVKYRFPDSLFSTYYHQRVALFKVLPKTSKDIIMLGNSITDGGEWSEMFQNPHIKNRGISGDISAGVLNRIDEVAERKPAKVFLLIGTNDLARGISPDSVVKNIRQIVAILHETSPKTQIFVQSIFPVNESFKKFGGHTSKKAEIIQVNQSLKNLSDSLSFVYLDVYISLVDETGRMNPKFTNDGLHLLGEGYLAWKKVIEKYLN